jgi:hypothetical protein
LRRLTARNEANCEKRVEGERKDARKILLVVGVVGVVGRVEFNGCAAGETVAHTPHSLPLVTT